MEHRARHAVLAIRSGCPTEFIDITDRIQSLVASTSVRIGLVNVQALHTTTAIVVNEHEPLLLRDFESTLANAAPSDRAYRHDAAALRTVNLEPDERVNGHAHCRALLLGPSACLNIVDGRLLLGRWQRVFFAELDGPRDRVVSVLVHGEGGAA
jgi:secondary thiamine-phosphate synthase enzyme